MRAMIALAALTLTSPVYAGDLDPCAAVAAVAEAVARAHNRGVERGVVQLLIDDAAGTDTTSPVHVALSQVATSAYDPVNAGIVARPALYGAVVEYACRQAAGEAQ